MYYQVPASITTTTTLPDVGLSAKTETDLINLGSYPTATKEWDYYSGSAPASPTRETDYTYGYALTGASLLTQVIVKDGSGNSISQTNYGYDETIGSGHAVLVTASNLPQQPVAVSGNRGNLTTTSQWINSSGTTLSTMAEYDSAGATLNSTDPNGQTAYGYDSTDTFVTSATPPTPSSGVSLATSAQFDFSTGLLTNTTDPNGRIMDNNINPPMIPVIVPPYTVDPIQPYCHRPYNPND